MEAKKTATNPPPKIDLREVLRAVIAAAEEEWAREAAERGDAASAPRPAAPSSH